MASLISFNTSLLLVSIPLYITPSPVSFVGSSSSRDAIHCTLALARPIALAIVEVCGTTYGTTKIVVAAVPDLDLLLDLLLFIERDDKETTRRACESNKAALSLDDCVVSRDGKSAIDTICVEDGVKADGIGRMWDASITEYWRSHMWMSISVDDGEIPARRT